MLFKLSWRSPEFPINPRFDEAVLALANLMDADGLLNEDSKERIDTAVGLVRNKPTACLLTSGGRIRQDCSLEIAIGMKQFICKQYKIGEDRVFVDTCAKDTVGDAIF